MEKELDKKYEILNSYQYTQNSYKFLNIYESALIRVISSYNPCYASINTLATQSMMSSRQCRNCISSLIEKKIISKIKKPYIDGAKKETDLLEINRDKIKELINCNESIDKHVVPIECNNESIDRHVVPEGVACGAYGDRHVVPTIVLNPKILKKSIREPILESLKNEEKKEEKKENKTPINNAPIKDFREYVYGLIIRHGGRWPPDIWKSLDYQQQAQIRNWGHPRGLAMLNEYELRKRLELNNY